MEIWSGLESTLYLHDAVDLVLLLADGNQQWAIPTRAGVTLATSHRQIYHGLFAVSHEFSQNTTVRSPFVRNALFGGAIFITVVIVIPQRFQVVNDLSAFSAGWRLLALMLCSPFGSAMSGFLVSKVKIPPFHIFLVAAILQIIGLALMSTLPTLEPRAPSAQYGYQVILGLGIGLTLSSLLTAAPTVIEERDTGKSWLLLLSFLLH